MFGVNGTVADPDHYHECREINSRRWNVTASAGGLGQSMAWATGVDAKGFNVQKQDGRTLSFTFQMMKNGGSVVVIEDITERKSAEARISHLARYDSLTGLPNRMFLREQMKQIRKLGPLESLLGMMPQVGIMKDLKNVKVDENEINRLVAIVDSMTPKERSNHMIINGQRRKRIAKGSGTSVQEVNTLLKQYTQMRKMMKSLTGGGGGFLGKRLAKMMPPGLPFGR